jgi:DNA polymerase (family 10)
LAFERGIWSAATRRCFRIFLDAQRPPSPKTSKAGIKIAVNTDAHSIVELDYIGAGINQARRVWLEAADILNTLPLPQLRKALKR